jgi:hypothetical protein
MDAFLSIAIPLNLTQQLYYKLIHDLDENKERNINTKCNIFRENVKNGCERELDFSYDVYNIYNIYPLLSFTDINMHSFYLHSKYLTSSFFNKLSKYKGSNSPTADNNLHLSDAAYNKMKKYCREHNPFYKFVGDKKHLIVRESEFYRKFSAYTSEICSKFKTNRNNTWDNFVVAGGSVFNCLNDYDDQDINILNEGDIDIFFFGYEEDQKNALDHVVNTITKYGIMVEIYKLSYNALEITSQNMRRIQLIMTDCETPIEIIKNFDLWASSVYYDGLNVIGNVNFLYCVKFWHEKLNKRVLKPKSMLRIAKYMKKGMRLYLSSKNSEINYRYLNGHMTVSMDKHIEQTVDRLYGDKITDPTKTTKTKVTKEELEILFPKFKLFEADIKTFPKTLVIDNSCTAIKKILEAWFEQATRRAHDINPSHVKYINKFYEECKKGITNNTPDFRLGQYVSDAYIGISGTLDSTLDSKFNNFEQLLKLLESYKYIIQDVRLHFFVEGTFLLNDKNIILKEYDEDQLNILKLFLKSLEQVGEYYNKKHFEFGETVRINYSSVGDPICDQMCVKGVLYVEYSHRNYASIYESVFSKVIVRGIYKKS